jgi:phosphate:Na+ symporter
VIASVLGGVGLFLLGMALMTDGLQHAAGDSLRNALRRSTRSRWSAVLTGAVGTAVVQSSSATTLATLGFVAAGLLPFTAAIGVVFGANFGTTITAWIVGGIGLKLSMNAFALPMVGVGALIKIFTRGRRASLGTALAGFGLIFVGIDFLQLGMQGIADAVPIPTGVGGLGGTLLLVIAGLIMTVVMQSSTAAVATTLAAVHSGTIGIDQAAAMAVGQNVGTTVTAAIASLGGSAAVRRIALAHFTFNVGTGLVALLLLAPFSYLAATRPLAGEPALALAGFHSAFNLLGIAIFLPFTDRLAEWLERAVPERGDELTRRLRTGIGAPTSAVLEAARRTASEIAREALAAATAMLSLDEDAFVRRSSAIERALDTTRERLAGIRSDPQAPDEYRAHVSVLHALDHLYRLHEALGEQHQVKTCKRHREVGKKAEQLARSFSEVIASESEALDHLAASSQAVAEARRAERPLILEHTARGALDPKEAERVLDALRWVDRIGYHAWRAFDHLERADRPLPEPPPESEGVRGDESYELLP